MNKDLVLNGNLYEYVVMQAQTQNQPMKSYKCYHFYFLGVCWLCHGVCFIRDIIRFIRNIIRFKNDKIIIMISYIYIYILYCLKF